jgi:hypothetical protein
MGRIGNKRRGSTPFKNLLQLLQGNQPVMPKNHGQRALFTPMPFQGEGEGGFRDPKLNLQKLQQRRPIGGKHGRVSQNEGWA